MPTACIDTPLARVNLRSEKLVVTSPPGDHAPEQTLGEIPLLDLEALLITEQVQITSQAVGTLLRRRIPLHYMDACGRPLGVCQAAPLQQAATRLRQYDRTRDAAFCLEVSRRLVEAKIFNERRLLQRLAASRAAAAEDEQTSAPPDDACESPFAPATFDETLTRLERLQAQSARASGLPELRGHEGAAAALYFQAWAGFLPPEFPFERRSTRPPHNPVNACLSYGSALLYHELVARLHTRGLDPGLGAFHVTDDQRWSLALDLMEPFRPAILESLALRLFSLRVLGAEDFEPREGGIYLSGAGRKKFLWQYERRLQREFLSEHAGHRTTLRQQLDEQAAAFKRALEAPQTFRPFRLN